MTPQERAPWAHSLWHPRFSETWPDMATTFSACQCVGHHMCWHARTLTPYLAPDAQVNGGQLPPHVVPYAAAAAVLAACIPLAAFLLTRAEARMSAAGEAPHNGRQVLFYFLPMQMQHCTSVAIT